MEKRHGMFATVTKIMFDEIAGFRFGNYTFFVTPVNHLDFCGVLKMLKYITWEIGRGYFEHATVYIEILWGMLSIRCTGPPTPVPF
jgi:hypothetical protein